MRATLDSRTLSDSVAALKLNDKGSVYLLVAKPAPGVHEVVSDAHVSVGIGFDADHERKSYYRGAQMPGRQVSAITSEFCLIAGLDPVDVGDNIVTQGIDLRALQTGDQLKLGKEVVLERTLVPHKPCLLFSERAGRIAYEFAKERNWRGALFNVLCAGTIVTGDDASVIRLGERLGD